MANVSTYMVLHVWEKASSVAGYDPDIWRKDFAGAWIRKDSYGLHTKYGWEVDHLQPLSKGGTNDLGNLAPLHWQNNQTKRTEIRTPKSIYHNHTRGGVNLLALPRVFTSTYFHTILTIDYDDDYDISTSSNLSPLIL